MSKVAVIGAGISGVAAAFYLQKYGAEVDLYESGDRIGGRIGSECHDGRWVDFGGKNIGHKYRRFREFVAEIGGLDFEFFGFNTSQVVNGKVVALSKEKDRLFNIFRVLSLAGFGGTMRLFPLIQAVQKDNQQGFLNTPYFNAIAEQFDSKPLSSFFPKGCADHLIRPVTVRMNGAEPEECYPGNFGSNLALVLDSYEQLKQGMHGMLERFESCLQSVRFLTGHHVQTVEQSKGFTRLHYVTGEKKSSAEYDGIIVALPAVQAVSLFNDTLPELAALLGQVRYYPVAVAIVRYREHVFPNTQRAMVFDGSAPLSNAGAYGINDLNFVRYTFSGIEARKLILTETNSENVISIAEKIIERFFNVKGNKRENYVYKYLDPGLCAYSQYHHKLLEKLDHILGSFRNIGLTGDYWRGASIEACFRSAEEAVGKLIYENAPQA